MAALFKRIVVVSILNILDFILATLLLFKSKWTVDSWLNATADLNFCKCTVDLWLIAVFRLALITGATIGIRINLIHGPARLKLSKKPIFCFSFGIIVYVLIKFLVSTECPQEHSSKIWLWLFFAQTCLFSIIFSWSWWFLGKHAVESPVLTVNADQEIESIPREQGLMSNSDSDDESNDSDSSSELGRYTTFKSGTVEITL